jgi:L-aminopeptidase/D-esterase-like protein
VFVLATGEGAATADPLALTRLGLLAADCLARAIARGVHEAERQGA